MITKLHNIVGHTSQTRHNLVGNFSKLNRVCVECARWSTCHRIWVDDTAAAALLWKKICVTLYRWEGKVGRARNLSCEKAEKWKIHIFSFIVGYTQTFFFVFFSTLAPMCCSHTSLSRSPSQCSAVYEHEYTLRYMFPSYYCVSKFFCCFVLDACDLKKKYEVWEKSRRKWVRREWKALFFW